MTKYLILYRTFICLDAGAIAINLIVESLITMETLCKNILTSIFKLKDLLVFHKMFQFLIGKADASGFTRTLF